MVVQMVGKWQTPLGNGKWCDVIHIATGKWCDAIHIVTGKWCDAIHIATGMLSVVIRLTP